MRLRIHKKQKKQQDKDPERGFEKDPRLRGLNKELMREKSLKLMKWKRRNVIVDGTNEEAQRDLRLTAEHQKKKSGR